MRSRAIWLVFAGGFLGTLLRVFMSSFGADLFGTLIVNVLGCAVLGLVQHTRRLDNELAQAFFATGFCGGFTTLSGIAAFSIIGNMDAFGKVLYLTASFGLGLIAYWVWARLGKSIGAVNQ